MDAVKTSTRGSAATDQSASRAIGHHPLIRPRGEDETAWKSPRNAMTESFVVWDIPQRAPDAAEYASSGVRSGPV
jgi:hypothetical protein